MALMEVYNFDQFEVDVQKWLYSGSTTWFVHGNFDESDALDIVNKAKECLDIVDISTEKLPASQTLVLQKGTATLLQ